MASVAAAPASSEPAAMHGDYSENRIRMSIIDPYEERGRSGPKGDLRNPAHRTAMLRRLTMIINDPRVTAETKAKAERSFQLISAIDRSRTPKAAPAAMEPKKPMETRKPLNLARHAGPITACILWMSLFTVRARLASARIIECDDQLRSGGQLDICIRNAIEARDQAIMIALAGPALAIIAAIIYRQYKADSSR